MDKNLRYLFTKFLKIGATSWGGYMALIAMIQKQICEKDKAIEEEKIVHAISLASVLPGPVAVNVVAYIGYQLKGIKGAFVSITAVLIPCFVLMLVLSYVYFTYGNIPAFTNFFAGVTPCIAALLISVAFTMAQKNIKDVAQIIIATAALLSIVFIHAAYTTIAVIIVSGVTGYFIYKKNSTQPVKEKIVERKSPNIKKYFIKFITAIVIVFAVLTIIYFLFDKHPITHLYKQIVFTFSAISVTQFGGGYVVIPALQKIVVDSLHWVNLKEFTDAIAMGQITPGPIYISAAFIGYKLDGTIGAAVSTIAIYLPAACVMLLCARFMDSIILSPVLKSIFKGVTAAVTGMIAAAGCTIFYKTQTISAETISIFIISLLLFIKFKLNPVYIIPLAGITGLLIF